MPISKKPRKKQRSQPKVTDTLPDSRGMEGLMTNLSNRRSREDSLQVAQGIMYQAWDESNRKKRVALARKALQESPLCADAYVLLAQEDAESIDDVLVYYERGVEAGEQALGPEGFAEYAGHFWGFLETRPYMRARAGLAALLWQTGRQQEAIDHYQAMLELNPNDNQGIRYELAGWLLARHDVKALKQLIRRYEDDNGTAWLYTRVLLAFRENDPDAEMLAEQAWLANSHVPGVLAGTEPLVGSMNGYITLGGADEAGEYVRDNGGAWSATAGAVGWLMERAKQMTMRPR